MRNFILILLTIASLKNLDAQAGSKITIPQHKQAAALNPSGFNSTECKRQEHYKAFEKTQPAFYALMAHLCSWNNRLMPFGEVRNYRDLWAKIANGENASTHNIKEFEALVKAKEKYDELSQNKKEYSLPILGFEPSDLLYSMIDNVKLNLLQNAQLRFYLKLYDCKLVDADIDTISGNAFSQMYNINEEGTVSGLSQNAGEILQRVFTLEKKYWAQKKEKSNSCTEEFQESPLQLFTKAITISLKQEIEINPKSSVAMDLSRAVRALAEEFNGKIVTPEMDLTIKSLSNSIAEIEKNAPRK